MRLRTLLAQHGITIDEPAPSIPQKLSLSLEEKVNLFRSLFQGREDVFARRWFSPTTGKSGYQPVCSREWNREYCNKKKYKCAECPNREFQSLSYDDIYRPLEGKDPNGRDVVGVYAILEDNTCNFLCCDFDDKNCEHGYQDDVRAYISVCRDWKISAYIERSRSGNGVHVWILFSEPISARLARRLGNAILTEAMEREGHMSFKSYDRFFPNQDFMPAGGFGNLVALPLQGQARKKGLPVYNLPRIVSCSEMTDGYLMLLRGCEDPAINFFSSNDVEVRIDDNTNPGQRIEVEFNGTLYEEQQRAIEVLEIHRVGTLYAATAFGKTVTAAALIAQKKVNTLILVHTKALLDQWRERLEEYLSTDFQPEEHHKGRGRRKKF